MYTKAWVIPWHHDAIGIAYERDDGVQGFTRLNNLGHPLFADLLKLLSPEDRRRVEERLSNVVPFPGS
jgi:hypothetical protein